MKISQNLSSPLTQCCAKPGKAMPTVTNAMPTINMQPTLSKAEVSASLPIFFSIFDDNFCYNNLKKFFKDPEDILQKSDLCLRGSYIDMLIN